MSLTTDEIKAALAVCDNGTVHEIMRALPDGIVPYALEEVLRLREEIEHFKAESVLSARLVHSDHAEQEEQIARLREVVDQLAPHSWTCGCGWRNGINLPECACCGRKPDQYSVQDEAAKAARRAQ